MSRLKVAVIVPAYNEESRIAEVLEAVKGSQLASEVIVVSDGSIDNTVPIARAIPGVRVLDLPFNMGKGGAMAAGVAGTQADIIAFVDADLRGLRGEHVDQIIQPLLDHRCDMCIGIFRGGEFWSDTAQRISPYISGQRAMKRKLFESIPFLTEVRMGVEVTINYHARRQKARILRVVLHGVSNTHKEQKLGFVRGAKARAQMYAEIGRAVVKTRRRRARRSGWYR